MALDDLLLKVKNRKLVVILGPILAGLMIGGTMVVKPSLKRLATLKTEKSGLSQKESLYRTITDQGAKLSEYREHLSKISDKAKVIEELNTLAAQSGLSVLSMVPDEKKVTANYLEKIGVKIDAEGNYHQLGEFVSRVESLEQFAKILNVDINTESDRDEGGAQEAGAAPRIRASKTNMYKISLVVGLFYPAQDVF